MLVLRAYLPRAEVSIHLWSIETMTRVFDHPSAELSVWLSCETIFTMIHHAQPALNKLLVVGGNGFIGLPFFFNHAFQSKLDMMTSIQVLRSVVRPCVTATRSPVSARLGALFGPQRATPLLGQRR